VIRGAAIVRFIVTMASLSKTVFVVFIIGFAAGFLLAIGV
jgi:allophanate hydrolase subunit 1